MLFSKFSDILKWILLVIPLWGLYVLYKASRELILTQEAHTLGGFLFSLGGLILSSLIIVRIILYKEDSHD